MLPARHRVEMANLALADAPWLAVDTWEAAQSRFVRTHEVVARVRRAVGSAGWPQAELFLVCGADLVHAMADQSRWPTQSVEKLFQGATVLWARRGDVGGDVFEKGGPLERYRERAMEMKGFTWGVSSTIVRYGMAR